LKALDIGPGDQVITAPNSFIATAAAIVQAGARPVFADVMPDQNIDPAAIEAAITPRTRAIMPVHLTGRVAAMDRIGRIARRHGLAVIEDAAQSMGSRYGGRMSGALGTVGCFSAHPLKNLNAVGDAGFLTTDDAAVAARVRRLRNHGLADRDTVLEWGMVSRLDTCKAAVLLYRLERLPDIIARRRRNAARYRRLLDPTHVFAPPCAVDEFNSFHTFVVQLDRRDQLRAHLAERGVGTAIHYPIPIHLQPAAAELGYQPGAFPAAERQAARILTLPIHQNLTPADIDHVADSVNAFYGVVRAA
jgi:dTDP-4-amino-4,6-dideoxygalactose transaminase